MKTTGTLPGMKNVSLRIRGPHLCFPVFPLSERKPSPLKNFDSPRLVETGEFPVFTETLRSG